MTKSSKTQRYRPYVNDSKSEICAKLSAELDQVVDSKNVEIISYCFAELSSKKHKNVENIERHLINLNLNPVHWLETAAGITREFKSFTEGKHNVYVILLEKFGESGNYALYIGMTGLSPNERFQNHKEGHKDAPSAREYAKKCLLPSLYEHLNPMGYEEAQQLEFSIAEALKKAHIPVLGGH